MTIVSLPIECRSKCFLANHSTKKTGRILVQVRTIISPLNVEEFETIHHNTITLFVSHGFTVVFRTNHLLHLLFILTHPSSPAKSTPSLIERELRNILSRTYGSTRKSI